MGKYMYEFNVGDKVRNESDYVIVEILKVYKNNNVKLKILSVGSDPTLVVGNQYYLNSLNSYSKWEHYEESSKNISPESIKELEKSIQKEKSNLNEFVENTRKNISDMEKSLEKLKKTANKVPTIEVGQMYSYNNSESQDIVAVCLRYEHSDNSWCMLYMNYSTEDLRFEWIYGKDFEDGCVTDFKHLNSPEQKKIAAGFYAFYTGDIPGV